MSYGGDLEIIYSPLEWRRPMEFRILTPLELRVTAGVADFKISIVAPWSGARRNEGKIARRT